MAQSGRAATKVPEPRMEHGLNTERESALMALEKEEITEKISSQLHLKGLFWESVFNPCSIRGSPENLFGNERFLLIVVPVSNEQSSPLTAGLKLPFDTVKVTGHGCYHDPFARSFVAGPAGCSPVRLEPAIRTQQ